MNVFLSNLRLFHLIIRKLTFAKFTNFFGLYLTYLFSHRKPVFYKSLMPATLTIEPADFCQLECPECPVGISHKKSGKLTHLNSFKQIIDQLKSELIYLNLFFQGEPLLNKNLGELISYANNSGIFTSVSTNAQLLNNKRAKELVECGLGKLIISLDGTNQEIYEMYRIGGKLNKVIEGIQLIQHWKKELGSKTPFIEIQFIVFKSNEHQLKDIKHLSKRLKVDKLSLKSAQILDLENGLNKITTFKKFARYRVGSDGKLKIKNPLKNQCWRQWQGAVVSVNGQILPCCFDKNSAHSFGNIEHKNFHEIWHGKTASEFRNNILRNRKDIDICQNCTTK